MDVFPGNLRAERGDFDFLTGRWRVTHRKRRERLAGSDEWDEFEADYEAWSHLGGTLSLDEFQFPAHGYSGCSVRLLDVDDRSWTIYWVTSLTGVFDSPLRGGWAGDRGEFHGTDRLRGETIDVRYIWIRDPVTPRWEQAFRLADPGDDVAVDGGWETNWTMTFHR